MGWIAIALAFALAQATGAPAAQDRPATALVMGRVIDAGTGRPVASAIINVTGTAAPFLRQGASSPTPVRVLTDANGRFVVRGLKKGVLVLNASKSGYLSSANGQRRPQGLSQPLNVDEGQRITDVEIRMWRHGVITGTVVDEAGEPVVGVAVGAYRRTFSAGRRRFARVGPADARTDDRGMFRLSGLIPGDYAIAVTSTQIAVPTEAMDTVTASNSRDPKIQDLTREIFGIGSMVFSGPMGMATRIANVTLNIPRDGPEPVLRPDGGLLVYPTLFYPASTTLAQATAVKVGSGEEKSGIDLQLKPAKSVRVSGTLLGPDGPAAHVGLRLSPLSNDDSLQELETARTMTDASGAFTFLGVPSGDYVLKVLRIPRTPVDLDDAMVTVVQSGGVTSVTTMTSSSGAPSPPPVPTDLTLHATMQVSVGDADVTGLAVALRPGVAVSGHLEFEGASDKPSANDIRNLMIQLDPADGSPLPSDLSRSAGHPEPDGDFRTVGAAPGRYSLHATSFGAWTLKSAMYDGRDISDMPIEMTKDITGVVLTYTDRMTRISGTVRDGSREDQNAVVVVFPVDSAAWSGVGAQPRRMRNSRADRKGAYRLSMLPPGDYYLVAIKDEAAVDWGDPAQLEALSKVAQEVRLADGEEKTVDLKTVAVR